MSNKLAKDDTLQLIAAANQGIAKDTSLQALITAITGLKTDLVTAIGNSGCSSGSSSLSDDVYEMLDDASTEENGAGIHNSIYRGKNLGTEPTSEDYANIANQTFKGMFAGDYWEKAINYGSTTDRLVRMYVGHHNYRLHCGNVLCETPHTLVVPAKELYNARMNSSNVTTGGYTGSEMKTTNLADAKTAFNNFFGASHILKHRELFINAVANGKPSGGIWVDSDVDLMNEPMVYGSHIFTPANDGSTIPYLHTIDKTQIALFQHRPDLISTQTHWWLRDVVAAAHFAIVNSGGLAHGDYGASRSLGVRPAALIANQ